MDELRQDLRYALRSIARRPGFSIIAIAMLALGVGINSAMFSVIRGVLLEPLPFSNPDLLSRVHHVNAAGGVDAGVFSPPDYEDLTAAVTSAQLAAFWHAPGLSTAALRGNGDPTLLEVAYTSSNFFDLMGAPPLLGRYPVEAEHVAGSDRVVVLSESLWRGRFGAAPDIVGRSIDLHGSPYTVIGVASNDFAYPAAEVDAWLTLSHVKDDWIPRRRGIRYLGVIARAGHEAALAALPAELSAIAVRLAEAHPESNADWRSVRIEPLRDELLGSVRTPLLVLAAAVMLVLLIACANLINLLLARETSRSTELALRSALGAGRWRIVRQLVTENVVLAFVSGLVGLLFAAWLVTWMTGLAGPALPRAQHIALDMPVFLFGLALSILTGLLTALMPAWRAGILNVGALKDGGTRNATDSRGRRNVRGLLVSGEMTLAVVLLVAAGLMLRSLDRLIGVDPGFDADNVLAVSLQISQDGPFSLESNLAYRQDLADQVASIPGVELVAMAKELPLAGGGEPYEFTIAGRSDDAALFRPEAGLQIVTPSWFEALRVPLLSGRFLSTEDESRSAPGIVINQAAAERHWPGEEAAGQVVTMGGQPVRIVGVVGNVRHAGLHAAPASAAYISSNLMPRNSARILVRTSVEPVTLVRAVRDAIRAVNDAQPVAEIVPLGATLERAMARDRFLTLLIGAFAALALVLSLLGIYGVVSYGVSQRVQEIGIRLALGAEPGAVVRMFALQSALWWAPGLLAGLVGAFAASRFLQSMLYDVSPLDPVTYLLVAVLLTGAAVLASVLPAARAARVDPASAFR